MILMINLPIFINIIIHIIMNIKNLIIKNMNINILIIINLMNISKCAIPDGE